MKLILSEIYIMSFNLYLILRLEKKFFNTHCRKSRYKQKSTEQKVKKLCLFLFPQFEYRNHTAKCCSLCRKFFTCCLCFLCCCRIILNYLGNSFCCLLYLIHAICLFNGDFFHLSCTAGNRLYAIHNFF